MKATVHDPVGEITVSGEYDQDADTKILCMTGDAKLNIPVLDLDLDATVCLDMDDPQSPKLKSIVFDGSAKIDPVDRCGDWSI